MMAASSSSSTIITSGTAYISVNYALHPPPSVSAPQNLEANKTHEFPIPNSSGPSSDHDNGQKAFYNNLRTALATAKETLGQELTAWRDVIGNADNVLDVKKGDPRKSVKQEGGDGSEEEEEEEEEEA
jgi:hypothetical protein